MRTIDATPISGRKGKRRKEAWEMRNVDPSPIRTADEGPGGRGLQQNLDDLRGRLRRMRAHMLVHTHALARLDQDLADLESELRRLAYAPQAPAALDHS